MTRRKLTEDEIDLWRQVADTTARLHPGRRAVEFQKPKPKPNKIPKPRLPEFTVGQHVSIQNLPNDLQPGLSEQLDAAPLRMDKKSFGRMKRGKLMPEARIDLHGMTMERAHPALNGFIMRCHAEGLRLVLVITGKGKPKDEGGPIPIRRGVLKHNVPQWLSMAPLNALVLQVSQAHISHGGAGAYYVYLRRTR